PAETRLARSASSRFRLRTSCISLIDTCMLARWANVQASARQDFPGCTGRGEFVGVNLVPMWPPVYRSSAAGAPRRVCVISSFGIFDKRLTRLGAYRLHSYKNTNEIRGEGLTICHQPDGRIREIRVIRGSGHL